MPKKSILRLEQTLNDREYNSDQIQKYLYVIQQILERGYVMENEKIVSASGIRPLFKVNGKSIDVYLQTTGELNMIRIHHPDNGCKKPNEACVLVNQKWVATNWAGPDAQKRGPNKGFIIFI